MEEATGDLGKHPQRPERPRERRSPANLILVGPGNDRQHLAELARSLGIAERVRFAGHCPDMRNAYFAADFLVHPTFYDPCSLVVLEALACGLPVITTACNGPGSRKATERT